MSKFYSRNYWLVGFQSRLYDRLSPESYFESMRRVVAALPDGKSLNLLDAGCGSGLLLRFLKARIQEGMVYTGLDILGTGVEQAGFEVQHIEEVYAGSAFLATGKLKKWFLGRRPERLSNTTGQNHILSCLIILHPF